MPDSRVTKIIKQVMVTLAKETGEQPLTVQEAEAFSAKSLRCGGCSAAAAEGVRDGVTQGHGGWLSRVSLKHYDLMQKGEETLTSSRLSAAVWAAFKARKTTDPPEEHAQDSARLDCNPRLATMQPSDSTDEEAELRYGVVKVLDVRRFGDELQYQVLWEDSEAGPADETTWEDVVTLEADGLSAKISGFWRSTKGKLREQAGLRPPSAKKR